MWTLFLTLVLTCQADQVDLPIELPEDPCAQKLYVNPAYAPTPSEYGLRSAYLWLKSLKSARKEFPVHLTQSERFADFLKRLNVDPSKMSVTTLEELMSVRFLYEATQGWHRIGDRQRAGALHVELMKMEPNQARQPQSPETSRIYSPFGSRHSLEFLSETNRDRLLNELEDRYPLSPNVLRNSTLRLTAEKLASELVFHFVQTHRNVGQFDGSPDIPLPSDRQMHALGWKGHSSFFSDLVETSDSVAFHLEATRLDQKLCNLTGQSEQIAVRLERDLAVRHGFLIPRFEELKDVSTFLVNWAPAILPNLLERNRLVLPGFLQTPEALAAYLQHPDLLGLFTGPQAYDRLTPFRTNLYRYVMTVEDGEKFLREAFVHFLLSEGRLISRNGSPSFSYFRWKLAGEAQSMFSVAFHKWLGLRGLDVRVPIVVSRSDYSTFRLEPCLRSARSPQEGR